MLTEGARSLAFESPDWFPGCKHVYWWRNDLHPGNRTLMLASQYTFTRAYYDDLKRHLYNPLNVKVRLVNAGRTSYQLYEETSSVVPRGSENVGDQSSSEGGSSGGDDVLFTSTINYVNSSTATGRPEALPEEFRALFHGHTLPVDKVTRVEKYPQNAVTISYMTRHSDADMQFHVNQSQYIKFCCDIGNTVCQRGGFSHLTGDLSKWKIKRCTNLFLVENLPNQTLDIHVWQNQDNPYMLHFYIEREGTNVFQGMLEFYQT